MPGSMEGADHIVNRSMILRISVHQNWYLTMWPSKEGEKNLNIFLDYPMAIGTGGGVVA